MQNLFKTFRSKLTIVYLIIIILPLTLSGVLLYQRFHNITRSQSEKIIKQTLNQANLNISYIQEEVENLASIIFADNNLQEILKKRDESEYEQVEDFRQINSIIQRVEDNPHIYRVRIFMPDSKIYNSFNENLHIIDNIEDNTYYYQLLSSNNEDLWTPRYRCQYNDGQKDVISYVFLIRDLDNIKDVIGCVFIDIPSEKFSPVLDEIKTGKDEIVSLVNGKGEMILISSNSEQNKQYVKHLIDNSYHLNNNDQSFNNININNQDFILINKKAGKANWNLMYLIPEKNIFKSLDSLRNYVIITIVIILIITIIIELVATYRLTKGFNDLINRMHNMGREYATRIDNEEDHSFIDEIGELEWHFNQMVDRIKNLMKKNYQMQIEKREAELKALQAQMNPHFLYNVLDSINWMAIRQKAMNINQMVTKLGRFYRIGLSGGKDIIKIGDELEHVQVYLEIQKLRFDNTIELILEGLNDLKEYSIPKLTLQPLVENAIVHGIVSKDQQKGIIKIEGIKKENEIIIKVKDNGTGINESEINKIMKKPQDNRGFGLKNIDERMKIYFGEEFGLEFSNSKEYNTIIIIRLPAEKN